MLSIIHFDKNINGFNKSKLAPIDKQKIINDDPFPLFSVIPIQPQSKKEENKTISNKTIQKNKTILPKIENKKKTTLKAINRTFKTFKEIKETKTYKTLLTIPRAISKISPPSLSYFVNYTYRKQIPLYMKHRTNWTFVTDKAQGFNFRWKYYSSKIDWSEYQYSTDVDMTKLKMINLFENYNEIGNKKEFVINMIRYCDVSLI